MAGIAVSTCAASRCATPLSGWPDTYRPEHLALEGQLVLVVPFLVGHLDGERRLAGGAIVGATAEQVELSDRLGLLGAQHRVDGVGVHQEQALAGCSSESKAPALIRDSVTFLLQAAMSILLR